MINMLILPLAVFGLASASDPFYPLNNSHIDVHYNSDNTNYDAAGTSVTLFCVETGLPSGMTVYRGWFLNSTRLNSTTGKYYVADNRLVLSNMYYSDAGDYTCCSSVYQDLYNSTCCSYNVTIRDYVRRMNVANTTSFRGVVNMTYYLALWSGKVHNVNCLKEFTTMPSNTRVNLVAPLPIYTNFTDLQISFFTTSNIGNYSCSATADNSNTPMNKEFSIPGTQTYEESLKGAGHVLFNFFLGLLLLRAIF